MLELALAAVRGASSLDRVLAPLLLVSELLGQDVEYMERAVDLGIVEVRCHVQDVSPYRVCPFAP